MNIPHLEPVKFAQEILSVEDTTAIVRCSFPSIPTLAMYYEAAAQSSACFSNEPSQIGFVVSVKEVEQLKKSSDQELNMHLTQRVSMGSLREFFFEAKVSDETIAQGIITIMLQGDA